MRVDLAKLNGLQSSFLNIEKDTETIFKKLFIESRPYSDDLKSLLVVNAKDCLSNKVKYQDIIDKITLKDLKEKYFLTTPNIPSEEHEEAKNYIVISFDNFSPNKTNPEYRDCTIHFDILGYTEYWELEDFQLRPIKIIGYIDGILNNCKLSGIGTLNFEGCKELLVNSSFSGYTLTYRAIHGSDDKIPVKE